MEIVRSLDTHRTQFHASRMNLRWEAKDGARTLSNVCVAMRETEKLLGRAAKAAGDASGPKRAFLEAVEAEARALLGALKAEKQKLEKLEDLLAQSEAKVRHARDVLYDALLTVNAGTLDAKEAIARRDVRDAAEQALAFLENEHRRLQNAHRSPALERKRKLDMLEAEAERQAESIASQFNANHGAWLNETQMHRLGEGVKSPLELGFWLLCELAHVGRQAEQDEDDVGRVNPEGRTRARLKNLFSERFYAAQKSLEARSR
jgi:hypothetical protein